MISQGVITCESKKENLHKKQCNHANPNEIIGNYTKT